MKMGAGLFWGIILIALGLSIIFKIIFGISIFRIVVATAFILLGIIILVGKPVFQSGNEKDVIFGERTYKLSNLKNSEYNTIFGKTVYDLSDLDSLPPGKTKVKFNTIFGSSDILLPAGLSVHIKADAVFSAAKLPNGNTVAFGSASYTSSEADTSASKLYLEASAVFGGININQKE
jgi:hypothetical protein